MESLILEKPARIALRMSQTVIKMVMAFQTFLMNVQMFLEPSKDAQNSKLLVYEMTVHL